MSTPSRWAVLLCKWKDVDAEPKPRTFFERLFTGAGRGSMNVVDYFDAMSHGKLDLSESQVFGWYRIDRALAEYSDGRMGVNHANRFLLMNLVRAQAARDPSYDPSRFVGQVICMNAPMDLFGTTGTAVCDPNSWNLTALGHEMGHGYGLHHAMRENVAAEYQDPWDIMSAFDSCFMSPHDEYTLLGPGLGAGNMRARSWLDETRVWRPSPLMVTVQRRVVLRPLHRHGLRGTLAAEVGPYLFEFRLKERWDAAIPRSAVLVHRVINARSYLQDNQSGSLDLVAGDVFEAKMSSDPVKHLRVTVEKIDESRREATLFVEVHPVYDLKPHPVEKLDLPALPWSGGVLGGGADDGGGIVIVNGVIIRVPPWNPMMEVLKHVEQYQLAERVSHSGAAAAVRRTALRELQQTAMHALQTDSEFGVPTPRTQGDEDVSLRPAPGTPKKTKRQTSRKPAKR